MVSQATLQPAPSITPCPVSWCPSAGHHAWRSTPPPWGTDLGYRFHRAETRICTGDEDTPACTVLTVSAEVFEEHDDPEVQASVQLVLDGVAEPIVLRSREVVEAVADAIRQSSDLAFELEPLSTVDREKPALDEFDAATAELVERAGKPQDVNRLVAAAIRFRNAYLGA